MPDTPPSAHQPAWPIQRQEVTYTLAPTQPGLGFGVTAMVLGIVGALLALIPAFVGVFLSFAPILLAFIFGIIAERHAPMRSPARGMAVAGIVLAILVFAGYFVGLGTLW